VAILAIAGAARVLYGPGALGYDGFWSLIWGRDLAHARVPRFDVVGAPTPHPLANLIGAVLSPLGGVAPGAFELLVIAAFGCLGWVCWRLGRSLFSRPVGLLFAALVLTRPVLINETLDGSIDVFFLVLVIAACALEAEHKRRGTPVLVLLAIAGLMRPESWLLSGAYLLYLWPESEPRSRWRLIALTVAAPAIWLGSDFVITGNPLYSLTGTQQLATELGRPRSLGSAFRLLPKYMQSNLGVTVFWCGISGALITCLRSTQKAFIPATLVVGGFTAFILLGFAHLPLLTRYMLLPTIALALFAATLAGGWPLSAGGTRWRGAWRAIVVFALGVLAAGIPSTRTQLHHVTAFFDARADVLGQLREVTTSGATQREKARCAGVYVESAYQTPMVAWWLGVSTSTIETAQTPGRHGLYIMPRTRSAEELLQFDVNQQQPTVPQQVPRVAANAAWGVQQECS
jgi:4-amino-4-deoxy-L-arabinose transferase-like glycosyltransferase